MEDLQNVISNEEQVEILNRQYNSLKHLISKIYNEDKYLKYRDELKNIKRNDKLFLTSKGKSIYDNLVYRITKKYFAGFSTKSKKTGFP